MSSKSRKSNFWYENLESNWFTSRFTSLQDDSHARRAPMGYSRTIAVRIGDFGCFWRPFISLTRAYCPAGQIPQEPDPYFLFLFRETALGGHETGPDVHFPVSGRSRAEDACFLTASSLKRSPRWNAHDGYFSFPLSPPN